MTATQNNHAITRAEDRPAAELMPLGKAAGLTTIDEGQFANLLDTHKFEHMWRVATLFSKSKMVPAQYQKEPENCFIAVQMAVRMRVDPFMFMQNTYIVHGKPGIEAKLAIALINTSGLFTDSLDYEVEGGDDPFSDGYRVRAYGVRKSTGKKVLGPWIDWALVRKEGWDKTSGSKWKTMPAQMFMYRAATFFGRLHCPERLMGMQTADELEDVGGGTRYVESTARTSEGLSAFKAAINGAAPEPPITTTVESAEPVPEPPIGEPIGEPSAAEQLAIQLSESAECTLNQAWGALDAFSAKLFGGVAAQDLDPKQFAALRSHVNAGDVTV
jgi:hypothetical protein